MTATIAGGAGFLGPTQEVPIAAGVAFFLGLTQEVPIAAGVAFFFIRSK